jgi:hypothetical protein
MGAPSEGSLRNRGTFQAPATTTLVSMQTRTKSLIRIFAVALLVSAYPTFVLGYTWTRVALSDLPGGGDGPRDAYRHTLASAVVAFTLGSRTVESVTRAMERSGTDANRMDRHNNEVGSAIGKRARSFTEIEPAVRDYVQRGAVHASDPVQVTWLPPEKWKHSILW